MLVSARAGAQARNPHTAVPASPGANPAPLGQPQSRPVIPANSRVAIQVAPTTVNGKIPGGPAAQGQQTSAMPIQSTPQTAAAPQPPIQVPPKPPRVSYTGGQLTVVADNSMMTDVLSGIRSATGIKMEGLGGNADRVYGQFGPASPRVVLDSLLNGSHYDFIILSSLETPDTVQRVILSPRGNSPNTTAANAPGRSMNRPPVQEDNEVASGPDEVTDEQPVPVAPVPAVQQPGQPLPVNPSTVQNQGQQPGGTQGGVKTPEQLLEELRRLNSNQRQSPGDAPRPQQPPDIVPR